MQFLVTIDGPIIDPNYIRQMELQLEVAAARAFIGCSVSAVAVNKSGGAWPCSLCSGAGAHLDLCPRAIGSPSTGAKASVMVVSMASSRRPAPAAPAELGDPFDAG